MKDRELIQAAALPVSGEPLHTTLTRADWLAVAIDLFKSQGIEAVKVTRLAQELGVTRGGFYWHFKGRDDLLNGLISFWRQKNTHSFCLALEGVETLEEGILALFSTWLDTRNYDPELDRVMRDWASRDPRVSTEVKAADKMSIAAIQHFFERMGFAQLEAQARARTVYFCQIGYYALNLNESVETRQQYLEHTVLILTGQPLSPGRAQQFRAHVATLKANS